MRVMKSTAYYLKPFTIPLSRGGAKAKCGCRGVFNELCIAHKHTPTPLSRGESHKSGASLSRAIFTCISVCLFLFIIGFRASAQTPRQEISLNSNWHTIKAEKDTNAYKGFETSGFNDNNWLT